MALSTKKGQTSTSRIIGGVPTTIDRHPYQASLQMFIDPNMGHICGAAIISDSWALTAGHCVEIRIGQFKLRVGSTYVEGGGSLHNVTQVIAHEHYDFPQNDIALLKVSAPFIFNRYVQPIPMQTSYLPPGTIVHVTGWGTTMEEVETYSNQLRVISIPLVDIVECKEIYDLGLTSRHMCAGHGKGKDSCQGDSGGPMVSFGNGCARPGIPGVYTKVSRKGVSNSKFEQQMSQIQLQIRATDVAYIGVVRINTTEPRDARCSDALLHQVFVGALYRESKIVLSDHSPSRIVGGTPTTSNKFPYQVSLQIPFYGHLCGYWVITAAHCVYDLQYPLSVKVGVTYWDDGQLRYVARIIQHPQYDDVTVSNDIALIKLVYPPFDLTCGTEVPVGTFGYVTGWGSEMEGGPVVSQLQQVSVPIVSSWECKKVYRSQLNTRHICAGYSHGGMDACQGDSGGPMVINGKLVGIMSFGIKCGEPNVPGVYTKISSFRDWIRMHTAV